MDVQTNQRRQTRLGHFFFASETPYGLALLRIILPLILLCVVLPRWTHSRELFSTDGAPAPLALNYGYHNFPPEPNAAAAVMMMTALVFFLVSASIGWHTRISLLASWGLYTYLNMLDCLSTLTKYSVISSHILLLLSLSGCGAIWSVDRWRMGDTSDAAPRQVSAWPRRLIQLLIGLIYFGAAFTKMHTEGFMSGDQIRFWLISNLNNTNPLGELLALYPELIVTMSHIAVIWQVLFVFLAWRGPSRLVMLGVGAMFHLSTIWLLGLFIFPPIMIATYLAWLDEDDVQRLKQWAGDSAWLKWFTPWQSQLNHLRLRASSARAWAIPSLVLFCILLSATVLGGLELEQAVDPYQRRNADGPIALTPMSQDEVQRMLRRDETLREADKFFAMELGSDTLGGVVVGRGTRFTAGDRVIVQCALIPPHEDMVIACSLHDDDGNELDRVQQPVHRDVLRANFFFTFPATIEPGTYRFKAWSDHQQVLSRTVQIDASPSTILGN